MFFVCMSVNMVAWTTATPRYLLLSMEQEAIDAPLPLQPRLHTGLIEPADGVMQLVHNTELLKAF